LDGVKFLKNGEREMKVFHEVEIEYDDLMSTHMIETLKGRGYVVTNEGDKEPFEEDYENLIDRLTNLRYDLIEVSERNDGKRMGQILRKFFSDVLPTVV
jgi:DNA-binding transcriptional regulator YhcF (GntR family)